MNKAKTKRNGENIYEKGTHKRRKRRRGID